mmetsp:Transcript_99078/g.275882  ORF Transcript_99078/g.275882 Transcript_99078/m.275882 type:complete len:92 (+) Transcript_99078:363-638(+)
MYLGILAKKAVLLNGVVLGQRQFMGVLKKMSRKRKDHGLARHRQPENPEDWITDKKSQSCQLKAEQKKTLTSNGRATHCVVRTASNLRQIC